MDVEENKEIIEDPGALDLETLPAQPCCELAGIEGNPLSLLGEGMGVEAYTASLVRAGEPVAALQVMCHALGRRRAVRLAFEGCREHPPSDGTKEEGELLAAVGAWLRDPTDSGRRDLGENADRVGLDRPAGLTAMAAFLSVGSIAPEGLQGVFPPVEACSKLASGALLISILGEDPEGGPERAIALLKRARLIALDDLGVPPPESDAEQE